MSDLTFQKATPDDASTFVELEKKVSHLKVYSGITDLDEARKEISNNEVYFVKKDGKVVGSCEYQMKSPDEAYLSGLVVDPQYQGQGIGRQAVEFRLNKVKDAKRVWLVTHPHNSRVIQLYLSRGFIIEAWKDNYYGDGEPRLVLALDQGKP